MGRRTILYKLPRGIVARVFAFSAVFRETRDKRNGHYLDFVDGLVKSGATKQAYESKFML